MGFLVLQLINYYRGDPCYDASLLLAALCGSTVAASQPQYDSHCTYLTWKFNALDLLLSIFCVNVEHVVQHWLSYLCSHNALAPVVMLSVIDISIY